VTSEQARAFVLDRLADIAPEADLAGLGGDDVLREELDLDSMDALTLLEELSVATGADISDEDGRALRTLDDIVEYLVRRT
jgi:acyl carrier protein